MGSYIYKALKFSPYMGQELGMFDFWYKPYPSFQGGEDRLKGVITDRMISRRPNGVQYVCHAPTRNDVWDKNLKKVVFKYPNENYGLPVVLSDYSKLWEHTFMLENAYAVCWGTKHGKTHFSTDPKLLNEEVVKFFGYSSDYLKDRINEPLVREI